MNAQLPTSATSQVRPSVLPDAWVEEIFRRLAALYGSKFADLWKGTDTESVKAVWAQKLAGFHDKPYVLKAALDACDDKPWPPTLPEFLGFCRNAAGRGDAIVALPPPEISKAEQERRAEKLAEASASLKFQASTSWAKRLRERYLSGEKLIHCQIDMASGALGEVWKDGKINPTLEAMQ